MQFPFYPFCACIFVIFNVFSTNFSESDFSELLLPLVVTLSTTAILLWLTTLALRSVHRAALLIGSLVILFLTYGQWVDLIWHYRPPMVPNQVARDQFDIFGIQIVIVLWIAYESWRIKNPAGWTRPLNYLGIILALIPLTGTIGQTAAMEYRAYFHPPKLSAADLALVIPNASRPVDPPDIYLIVLDAHARQDILKNLYSYDDSFFLDHLRQKGFYIADKSSSNYRVTYLSLASMLNLRYPDEFVHMDGGIEAASMPLIEHNVVVSTLKTMGYRWVAFESAFGRLSFPQADTFIRAAGKGFTITPLQRMLIDLTDLGPLRLSFGQTVMGALESKHWIIQYQLSHAPMAAELPGPKFVFLHIFAPHPPFVFQADGSQPAVPLSDSDLDPLPMISKELYRQAYHEQVSYIDHAVQTMIDGILAHSAKPPVIILCGDHGARSNTVNGDADKTDLNEAYSNLCAIYLPGKNNAGLVDTITPVNYFRVVLNDYFNAGLPMLPDKMYFVDNHSDGILDVTNRVRPLGKN